MTEREKEDREKETIDEKMRDMLRYTKNGEKKKSKRRAFPCDSLFKERREKLTSMVTHLCNASSSFFLFHLSDAQRC